MCLFYVLLNETTCFLHCGWLVDFKQETQSINRDVSTRDEKELENSMHKAVFFLERLSHTSGYISFSFHLYWIAPSPVPVHEFVHKISMTSLNLQLSYTGKWGPIPLLCPWCPKFVLVTRKWFGNYMVIKLKNVTYEPLQIKQLYTAFHTSQWLLCMSLRR